MTRRRVSALTQIVLLHDLIDRWRRHCSRIRGMLIDEQRRVLQLEAEIEQLRAEARKD